MRNTYKIGTYSRKLRVKIFDWLKENLYCFFSKPIRFSHLLAPKFKSEHSWNGTLLPLAQGTLSLLCHEILYTLSWLFRKQGSLGLEFVYVFFCCQTQVRGSSSFLLTTWFALLFRFICRIDSSFCSCSPIFI